eukprot:scaffold439373_cov34-Prasinocladus_malaysianus.AAC.1
MISYHLTFDTTKARKSGPHERPGLLGNDETGKHIYSKTRSAASDAIGSVYTIIAMTHSQETC